MHRFLFALWALYATAAAAAAPPAPPNLVVIDSKLTTSGQPSAQWLATLAAQGYEAVIYLAPSNVSDAVREEPKIVAAQGLAWHHLPIPFGKPDEADYEAFAQLLQSLRGKKVLVHCQVNMRASTMTFLYRTIVEKATPDQAYAAVSRVWTPEGPWRRLMLDELREHGIDFDPF